MTRLVRNAKDIKSKLRVTNSGQVLSTTDLVIQAPARFPDIGLGEVGMNTVLYGLFAIIDRASSTYAVTSANALIGLKPAATRKLLVDDVEYYEFSFPNGSVVYENLNILRRDDILFSVFDEFFFKGKVPWYVGYEDLCKLFDTSEEYAGSNVASIHEIIEFLASMITRDSKDRTVPLRMRLNSYNDLTLANTDYVPLQSVLYSVNSTVNKLTGAYFNDGVTSALVNPTEKPETIEKLLRA